MFGYQEDQNEPNLRSIEPCTWALRATTAQCLGGGQSTSLLHPHPEPLSHEPNAEPGTGLGLSNGSVVQLLSSRPLEHGLGLPANNCYDFVNYFGGRVRDFGRSYAGPCMVINFAVGCR